jgi:transcriptional regulator GlxA family with amidase domain
MFVAKRTPEVHSAFERDVVKQIRVWRASPGNELQVALINNPARFMHHLIMSSHGHVKLRFRPVARELGLAMRTLERAFVREYGKSMLRCQIETRIAFSQHLLRIMPPTKIIAIANLLGYDEVRDFNRFFERHMHETPSAWGRKERQRTRRIEDDPSRNRGGCST